MFLSERTNHGFGTLLSLQPQGQGKIPRDSSVTALLIDPLGPPPVAQCFFRGASGLDDLAEAQVGLMKRLLHSGVDVYGRRICLG